MKRTVLVLSLALTSACVSVRDIENERFEGDSFDVITAQLMRGDIEIIGRNVNSAEVTATLWASGTSQDRAAARQSRLRWSAELIDRQIAISSIVPETRSGVDFHVVTPEVTDTLLSLERGEVRFNGVDGLHEVYAPSVFGVVGGEVILDADNIDLALYPFDVSASVIDSRGAVTLALPFGLDYDLVVRGNPEAPMVVDDLGWDDVRPGEGFFSGFRGRGLIRINVFADGPVEILRAR